VRWKNILLALGLYQLSRRSPNLTRRILRKFATISLPPGYEVDKHFNPRYQPWDQRMCFVPDSDLFRSLSSGRASIVTGQIDAFTESGIRLQSGEELPADIIVSATGLQMLALGGIHLEVDGKPVNLGGSFIYKGVMLGNVPNFAFCVGYTNASWTLRADLASIFVSRLLRYMKRRGFRTCVPICDPTTLDQKPLLDLTSGYVLRAAADLPKQSSTKPWFIRQNYILDMLTMKLATIDDGILQFATSSPLPDLGVAAEVTATSSAQD
jgi:cation diffusion facilitator CzcD-associated flavoprotein CzcO